MKKKEKEILEKWEKAWKPRWKALEKWAKQIADKQVDRKFAKLSFWFRTCISIAIIVFVVWKSNGESFSWTWKQFLWILWLGFIYRLLSLVKEETRTAIWGIILVIFIIWIIIALCVRLFWAVWWWIVWVLAVIILLKVLNIL